MSGTKKEKKSKAPEEECPSLPNPPSLVEHEDMRFLIFDAPSDDNLDVYAKVFKYYNVKVVVRVCDPTYSIETLQDMGFETCEWAFGDGGAPPKNIVDNWLALCRKTFKGVETDRPCIGVHCVAGLGRAPILVAIALIESGMDAIQTINLVRTKRRGSINRTQLQYLKKYKRSAGRCIVM
jgi:protein tyrosine phosphatase type 4A